jgi:hypothetical protein
VRRYAYAEIGNYAAQARVRATAFVQGIWTHYSHVQVRFKLINIAAFIPSSTMHDPAVAIAN